MLQRNFLIFYLKILIEPIKELIKIFFFIIFSITSFFSSVLLVYFYLPYFMEASIGVKYGLLLSKLAPTGTVILSISSLMLSVLFAGVFLYLDSLNNPDTQND